MHDGTSSFLKLFSCLLVGVGFIAWLHIYFSPTIALVAICLLAGTIFFTGGALLATYTQKSTLDGVAQFSAKDAVTDRYRMQSLRELAKGEAWKQKAEGAKELIVYKQEQKLLSQKPDENETFWTNTQLVDTEDWS